MRIPLSSVGLQGGGRQQFVAPQGGGGAPNDAPQDLQRLGRQLQQRGDEQMRLADQAQDEFNAAKIKTADSAMADAIRESMSGYKSLVGSNALGDARDKAFAAIDEKRRAIEATLTTPVQRERFAMAADSRMVGAREDADAHQNRQAQNFAIGASEARRISAITDAADGFGTDRYDRFKAIAIGEANQEASLRGYSDDQRKLLVLDATNALHTQVLDSLVSNGQAKQARDYLAANGGEMAPQDRNRATRIIQREVLSEDAAQLATHMKDRVREEMLGQRGALSQDREPTRDEIAQAWSRAYDMLDESQSAGGISEDLRAATADKLRVEQRRIEQSLAQSDERDLRDAEKWLRDNPLETAKSLPADLYDRLEQSGHLTAIESFADGRRYTTDPKAYAAALAIPEAAWRSMSPAQVYTTFRPLLADNELRTIQAMHAHATGGGKEEDGDIVSLNERIKESAAQAGIIPRVGGMSDAQAASYYQFQLEVQNRIRAESRDAGRKLNADQKQAIMDAVASDKGFIQQSFMGIDSLNPDDAVRFDQMTPEQQASAYVVVNGEDVRVASIPAAETAKITEALRARGIQPTKKAIADLWVRAGKPK